jgi:hypothetical protein
VSGPRSVSRPTAMKLAGCTALGWPIQPGTVTPPVDSVAAPVPKRRHRRPVIRAPDRHTSGKSLPGDRREQGAVPPTAEPIARRPLPQRSSSWVRPTDSRLDGCVAQRTCAHPHGFAWFPEVRFVGIGCVEWWRPSRPPPRGLV